MLGVSATMAQVRVPFREPADAARGWRAFENEREGQSRAGSARATRGAGSEEAQRVGNGLWDIFRRGFGGAGQADGTWQAAGG